MFSNKTIIFGAPFYFFNKKIISSLKQLGFNVIDISFEQKYQYKSLYDRWYNFYRKVLFNDKSYKTKLRFSLAEEAINMELKKLSQKADYALIIRPDIYPEYFLKQLKEQTQTMIGYQWDGMKRFSEVRKVVEYFDRFFVFDENDLEEDYLPTTNFFFDEEEIPSPLLHNNITLKKQVFFVGSFIKERLKILEKIAEQVQKTDFVADISLRNVKPKIINKYHHKLKIVKIYTSVLSLEENYQRVQESMVLVDVLNEVHNGLSFRTFEALKYRKKLITTNKSIRYYDFYNEQNFLILENDDSYAQIPNFLRQEYQELPLKLYEKYSFTNWIKYMLDIQPYIPIELPCKNKRAE